jgi:hypothetical protein
MDEDDAEMAHFSGPDTYSDVGPPPMDVPQYRPWTAADLAWDKVPSADELYGAVHASATERWYHRYMPPPRQRPKTPVDHETAENDVDDDERWRLPALIDEAECAMHSPILARLSEALAEMKCAGMLDIEYAKYWTQGDPEKGITPAIRSYVAEVSFVSSVIPEGMTTNVFWWYGTFPHDGDFKRTQDELWRHDRAGTEVRWPTKYLHNIPPMWGRMYHENCSPKACKYGAGDVIGFPEREIWWQLKHIVWGVALKLAVGTDRLCVLSKGGTEWFIVHLLGLLGVDIEMMRCPATSELPHSRAGFLPCCGFFHQMPQDDRVPDRFISGRTRNLRGEYQYYNLVIGSSTDAWHQVWKGKKPVLRSNGKKRMERFHCSLTDVAWGLWWAYWVMPEIFPVPKVAITFAPPYSEMLRLWKGSVKSVLERIANPSERVAQVETTQNPRLPFWPGSAPMPNYTPWWGLCSPLVKSPVDAMRWEGPRAIFTPADQMKRQETPMLLFPDSRHQSPYGVYWPGDTRDDYSIERRTHWGPFSLTMPEGEILLRSRPAQRARGLYGAGRKDTPFYIPRDIQWKGVPYGRASLRVMSEDQRDRDVDLQQMQNMYLTEEEACTLGVATKARPWNDVSEMSHYQRLVDRDGDYLLGWDASLPPEVRVAVLYG